MLKSSNELKNIYKIAMKLEGLKRHTSTHAAGVVISSVNLDDVIPILYNGDVINTGITGSYLEELGFLKMDFLAISNLTVIHNATKLIGPDFDINKINLNDFIVWLEHSPCNPQCVKNMVSWSSCRGSVVNKSD